MQHTLFAQCLPCQYSCRSEILLLKQYELSCTSSHSENVASAHRVTESVVFRLNMNSNSSFVKTSYRSV